MPQRRCVACGRTAPKVTLHRVVLAGESVVADPSRRRPGRGAYVCDAACAAEAVRRKGFNRSFRAIVTAPDPSALVTTEPGRPHPNLVESE